MSANPTTPIPVTPKAGGPKGEGPKGDGPTEVARQRTKRSVNGGSHHWPALARLAPIACKTTA